MDSYSVGLVWGCYVGADLLTALIYLIASDFGLKNSEDLSTYIVILIVIFLILYNLIKLIFFPGIYGFSVMNHNEISIIKIVAYTWLPVALLGGKIAYIKGDFYSRGFSMLAITWVFGLFFLLKAPYSKAKVGDEYDYHNWHSHTAAGGVLMFVVMIAFMLIENFIAL